MEKRDYTIKYFICKVCGTPYTSHKPVSRYCSKPCSYTGYRCKELIA